MSYPDAAMSRSEEAPLVAPGMLEGWILREDDDVLVVNKPGWLVCHPSKNGPCSSLVGAVREYLGYDRLHLVARLDRETSGLILYAKHRASARRLQMALQARQVTKTYHAVLRGAMTAPVRVDWPLLKDRGSIVHVKQRAAKDRSGGESAETWFYPLVTDGVTTLCRVEPVTGRKHQIRVHAEAIGFPIIGDKLYGGNEGHYLDFIEKGWSSEMEADLGFHRQALHCSRMVFCDRAESLAFHAPPAADLDAYLSERGWSIPEVGSE